MKRHHVQSTTLTSAGYDKLKHIVEVQFTSGKIYQYLNVPYKLYKEMLTAESIGAYFNFNIKKFPYREIT